MSDFQIRYIHPESEFLENAWYVAAPVADITEQLKTLRILGQDIVFFRSSNGKVNALEDACPHRKLPLSMGQRVGDDIQCGYHGLTFNGAGQCVAAPTQARIPASAVVRSYPIAERYGLLWIWMGDPSLAQTVSILQIDDYEDSSWGLTPGGVLQCACHYLYLLDNLLDPSHVSWVHKSSFASDGTDDEPLVVEPLTNGVVVSRWIKDIVPPPYYAPMLSFEGRVDRYQHYEVVTPSIAINKGTYTRAGQGGDNSNLPADAYIMRSYHFITPIDSHQTRYHWFQHYNTNAADEDTRKRLNDGARMAFEEDRVILEAVHKGMLEPERKNIDLRLDKPARMFREKLLELISSEKAA
ncbi:MAG: phenylpropionate dioxygenase-like ring-hydroxylating dioxygenase large terminal subunit [Parasphingorhabdus sp.]|jgi:phenylpropionate dioxygenase-like ring-hydroxylating dioxygenase large terminal subunit